LIVFALSGLTITGGMTLACGAISSTVVVSNSSADEMAAGERDEKSRTNSVTKNLS
jgi:hypothetical protein